MRSVTILVVEDDEAMLMGISDLLEVMGLDTYDVQILMAENGAVGLQRINEHIPDLIISDVNMPVMDGYAFFDAVRQRPEWLYIPFLFLTAQGEKDEIRAGRTSGVDLYITKPFNGIHLIELVKTQLEKAEKRQLQREEENQNFKKGILQILNHEFRTPLTYVTASYEMLMESVSMHADDQYFHEYLRGIQMGCVRLTRLVDDLIMVIELRTGEMRTQYEKEVKRVDDITAVLLPVVQQHEDAHANDESSVHIHVDIAENLPAIQAVPAHLEQIVSRLLGNGIKFTPTDRDDGRHITLSVTADKSVLKISVRDEGIGIPKQVQGKIFDVFYQYNREYLEQQGAGIGLTIVNGLLELHGGWVEVESVPDEGSVITAVFPIHTNSAKPASKTAVRRRKATVLIVEDDPDLLQGLVDLLSLYYKTYDISTYMAENGLLALEILKEVTPSLILSDVMMPYMDGLKFLQAVRENPAWINIPFIFLTARGERDDIFAGLQGGAEAYITKPYDSGELLDLIDTELNKFFQKQQEQAQGFDELKRHILNLMSPDFQASLADVSFHSSLLADAENDQNLKTSLRGIQEGNSQLTRLIENFIGLAELEAGETAVACQLRSTPIFNIGILFHDAMQAQYKLIERYNIPCTPPVMMDETPLVYGDAILLSEALRRIIMVGLTHFSDVERQEMQQFITFDAYEIQLSTHFTIPPSDKCQESIERALTTTGINPAHMAECDPDLKIAKGYIELNNGRLHTETDADGYSFIVTLPIYEMSYAEDGIMT